MSNPAIPTPPQQGQLILAVATDLIQEYVTEPYEEALCDYAVPLSTKAMATIDPTLQEVLSCDGRYVSVREIERWRGAFQTEIFANSRDLAWQYAIAWGGASSATPVSAGSAVFTETVTATGGTRRLIFDGLPTDPIAYSALAATIQTAVDNRIGAGKLVVSGLGPYVYTAAGALANLEVRQPTLSTLKLTGGTSTIVQTTPGGPARSSYALTQDEEDEVNVITAVLGYEAGPAIRLADLAIDTLTLTETDAGLWQLTADWIWSGLYEVVTGYTFPDCTTPKQLKSIDSRMTMLGVDVTTKRKALTYRFSNRIDLGRAYTNTRKTPQRLVRQWPLTNEIRAAFEEGEGDTAILTQMLANSQNGTTGATSWTVGGPSDGAAFAVASANHRLDGAVHRYDNGMARVPVAIDTLGAATVTATAVTSYADGFLDEA